MNYRTWNPEDKKMYSLLIDDDGHKTAFYTNSDFEVWKSGEPASTMKINEVEHQESWINMEGTGIDDMHGREVYDGDILNLPYNNTDGTIPAKVYKDKSSGKFVTENINKQRVLLDLLQGKLFEIQGHIYSNPEIINTFTMNDLEILDQEKDQLLFEWLLEKGYIYRSSEIQDPQDRNSKSRDILPRNISMVALKLFLNEHNTDIGIFHSENEFREMVWSLIKHVLQNE